MFIHLTKLHLANFMPGLDFNPTGESVATLDRYGNCLISDMNTDSCICHQNLDRTGNFDI